MPHGDLYTQTAHSLGYAANDWAQLGWSLKPRYSPSVRVGAWSEEVAPLALPVRAIFVDCVLNTWQHKGDGLSTMQASYVHPIDYPDPRVRALAHITHTASFL
jgi:hypothetical protein